jgi:hypothetical protein
MAELGRMMALWFSQGVDLCACEQAIQQIVWIDTWH